MKKKNFDWKTGAKYFFGIFIVTFIFLYLFISPFVQDAYQKGYERGLMESCPDVLDYMSQHSQVPFDNYFLNLSQPAGNQS